MACILHWRMDVTRQRISRIFELREILLSFQSGFSLVNAAVVCAILESISGLEPSSVITEPRYLKLETVTEQLQPIGTSQLIFLAQNSKKSDRSVFLTN